MIDGIERAQWVCKACAWEHHAHPIYGWSERDVRAVEVHQIMLCPMRESENA